MLTNCARCANHQFELKVIEPAGADCKFNVLQCSNCGCPIGAFDSRDFARLLADQQKLLVALEGRIRNVEAYLTKVTSELQRL